MKQKTGPIFVVIGLVLILGSIASISLQSGTFVHLPGFDNQIVSGSSGFSPAELKWIAEHPVIRVAPDPKYKPFEFFDRNGVYSGISADYLALISKKTGIRFQAIRVENFTMSTRLIQKQSADMLGAVYTSDLRDGYLIYSRPYFETPIVIIVNNSVTTPLTLEELAGKRVAAIEGYTTTQLLMEQYPEIVLDIVSDTRAALLEVSLGNADAYFGDLPTATAMVDSSGITNLHVAGEYNPDKPDQFALAFGIRKDMPELASILSKSIRMITEQERDQILDTWISSSLSPDRLSLKIIIGIIAGTGVFIMILGGVLIWNRTLQNAVNEKTRELSHELDERKRAEEALKITRFSIDRTIDPVIWTDAVGTILDVNATACHKFGYTYDALTRMTIFDLNRTLKPTDWQQHWNSLKTEGFSIAEEAFTTQEGEVIPVEVRQNYFEYEGREGNCAIVRDIRHRKMTEQLIGEAFFRIDHNMEQFAALNDQIRNPLNIILCHASETDTNENRQILEQVHKIDDIVDTLDQGWVQSEKIRAFLRKHYPVKLQCAD